MNQIQVKAYQVNTLMELAILTTYLNSSYFTTLPLNSELDVPTLLSQDQGQAQERLCPRTLGTEPHRASLFQRLWPLKLREKSRRWFFYRLKMWPKGHPSEGDWSKETIYGAKSTNRAWPHFLHIIDIQIIVAPLLQRMLKYTTEYFLLL